MKHLVLILGLVISGFANAIVADQFECRIFTKGGEPKFESKIVAAGIRMPLSSSQFEGVTFTDSSVMQEYQLESGVTVSANLQYTFAEKWSGGKLKDARIYVCHSSSIEFGNEGEGSTCVISSDNPFSPEAAGMWFPVTISNNTAYFEPRLIQNAMSIGEVDGRSFWTQCYYKGTFGTP